MVEAFYLGAYWGSRSESSLECSERLQHCLTSLGQIDPALSSWFRRGASKAAAKTPIELDLESLNELLIGGRSRRDFGGEVIEELGFSVGLWNRAKPVIGLSTTVGAHPSFPGVLNSFVLNFPPPETDALRLYEPGVAQAILEAVVEAWEPAWATWSSPSLRAAQGAGPREPVLGWMTYFDAPATDALPDLASRPLLQGRVIQIGAGAAAVNELDVLSLRQQLGNAAVLHPIP
jgi:hypothetical protein